MGIGNEPQLSVASTKLYPPRVPSDLVRRHRLYELLNRDLNRPFTLVSAPAGYGKSTLIANWLKSLEVGAAWLSIEESDNNLRQFLIYLVAAVRNHSKRACAKTIELVQSPELPPLATLRDFLANDLDAIRKPFVLVLDDFFRIKQPEIHETVDYLLDFPPRSLHLTIITRHDPPLQLNRLRAGGRMVEVRERDLRFTKEETHTALKRLANVDVADDVLNHIHSELEGWIVGLRLACLALRNREDPEPFLRGLSGGTPAMQDYLAGEVLSQLPDAFRRGLLSLSILDRFCASLCAAVSDSTSEQDGGAQLLPEIIRANLFTIELDDEGEWFRFHHLFQRLLLNQLESQAASEDIAALHLRASHWFEMQGMLEESVRHAMAAKDVQRAARLLDQFREMALKTDHWYVLEKWLSKLPDEALRRHPELLMVRAWMYVHHFQYPLVIRVLNEIEISLSGTDKLQHLKGEIANLRGMALHRLGDGERGLAHLESALSIIPEASLETRAQAEVSFCLASQQEGKKDEALQFLDRVMHRNPPPEGIRRSRLDQVYVFLHIISGHLAQAEKANQPIGALTDDRNTYGEAFREYLQGLIHLYRFEPDVALQSLDYFRRTTSRRYIQFRRAAIDSIACLALACQFLGRTHEVETALQLLREFVSGTGDARLSILIDSATARVDALRGCGDSTVRWAETTDMSFDPTKLWFFDTPRDHGMPCSNCRRFFLQPEES